MPRGSADWHYRKATSEASSPDTAACIEAVAILEESSERVERLWRNAEAVRAGLKSLGFDTGKSVTPIVPVLLGEAATAQAFSRALFEEGVFAMAIGYPTVPMGKARIRVMNSAAHSPQDLEEGLAAFERVGRQLGLLRD